jgi:hypothetical protein
MYPRYLTKLKAQILYVLISSLYQKVIHSSLRLMEKVQDNCPFHRQGLLGILSFRHSLLD